MKEESNLQDMITLTCFVLILASYSVKTVWAQQDSTRDESDIVDTAIQADNFNTFVQALQAADLVETLRGDGPFTVFAPTDDAFAALSDGQLESLLKPKNKSQLQAILKYHVVSGTAMASDVTGMDAVPTLQGRSVQFQVDDGTVKLMGQNTATVVQADIEASNGVIHVIDSVLLPPGEDLPESPSFSRMLRQAAERLEAPLEMQSYNEIGVVSKENYTSVVRRLVESTTILARSDGKYEAISLGKRIGQERKKELTEKLTKNLRTLAYGDAGPSMKIGDKVIRVHWSLKKGRDTFSTRAVVSPYGRLKFEPLLWMTPANIQSDERLKEDIFWSGWVENGFGTKVVTWKFKVEFVSDNACGVSGVSVEETVSAPGWGWSAKGTSRHSIFCVGKEGCSCSGTGQIQAEHMECVKAEAEIGFGSGTPEIGVSGSGFGITVGGLTAVDSERSRTGRVCADGASP